MLNQVTLLGRTVREPELRRTGSGIAVTYLTLAIDRDYMPKEAGERETDFIDVVIWRQPAEYAAKYIGKGDLAAVTGRLQPRSWTDKDGNRRRTLEVVAEKVHRVARRLGDSSQKDGGQSDPQEPDAGESDYGILDDDAQLPF